VIVIDLDDREVLGPQRALDRHRLTPPVKRHIALVPYGPDLVSELSQILSGVKPERAPVS
jgi:hypothetical protein